MQCLFLFSTPLLRALLLGDWCPGHQPVERVVLLCLAMGTLNGLVYISTLKGLVYINTLVLVDGSVVSIIVCHRLHIDTALCGGGPGG